MSDLPKLKTRWASAEENTEILASGTAYVAALETALEEKTAESRRWETATAKVAAGSESVAKALAESKAEVEQLRSLVGDAIPHIEEGPDATPYDPDDLEPDVLDWLADARAALGSTEGTTKPNDGERPR